MDDSVRSTCHIMTTPFRYLIYLVLLVRLNCRCFHMENRMAITINWFFLFLIRGLLIQILFTHTVICVQMIRKISPIGYLYFVSVLKIAATTIIGQWIIGHLQFDNGYEGGRGGYLRVRGKIYEILSNRLLVCLFSAIRIININMARR